MYCVGAPIRSPWPVPSRLAGSLPRASPSAAAPAGGAALAAVPAGALSLAAAASLSRDCRATAGGGAAPSRNTATAITPTFCGRSLRPA
ncbi:MAG TPA: hypothetical protein DGC76_07170 [Candidatus Accumulibacter sp.]|nr:hypothetical protein [Accumulibacter sp.]